MHGSKKRPANSFDKRLASPAPERRNGETKPAHLEVTIAIFLGLWPIAMAFALGLVSL
jgi:hypothetical protein